MINYAQLIENETKNLSEYFKSNDVPDYLYVEAMQNMLLYIYNKHKLPVDVIKDTFENMLDDYKKMNKKNPTL